MGKSDWERQIQHFSHDHPLELTNTEEVGHECFGCKSAATGWMYRCNKCNFDLHMSCSAIPLQIKHPVDSHPLVLLAQPICQSGHFMCNACGINSKGFPFHCTFCKTDLHPSCANLPLQFYHPYHCHALALSFSPPYPQKVFSCDVCNKPGKDSWHYHCSQCLFDVHVTCINLTSQTNKNPILPQPIMATRPLNVANSPINSLINTPRSMLSGFLHRPAGPSHPATFSQMPVQGLPVPMGTPMGAASRSSIKLPAMIPSVGNISSSSTQNQQPSYQSTICNGLVQGAATAAGSIAMKLVLGDIIGGIN